jgi:hypothetical protein
MNQSKDQMMNSSISAATEFYRSSNSEQRIAALYSIEELKDLTLEDLQWIADAGTERSVQDGELIFSQAAPPHHLIFVLAGEVVIKRHTLKLCLSAHRQNSADYRKDAFFSDPGSERGCPSLGQRLAARTPRKSVPGVVSRNSIDDRMYGPGSNRP